MAESTRYRVLEDQMKKQEIRLQELTESMAALHTSGQNESRQKLQEKMEKSNSRMEAVVGNLDQKFGKLEQKFNALMKVMLKDKEVQENEGGSGEPLLPTPPPHLRLPTQADTAGH